MDMTTDTTNIIQKMQEMQTGLYNDSGGKNMFFKKTQKLDIAKTISENFDFSEMISKSIYILPNKQDEIYIDYTVLKLFIHEGIYEKIIDHILVLLDECIKNYGKYSLNVNLEGFTISAAERHKNAIIMFSNICVNKELICGLVYSELYNTIRIFNMPSVMDSLIQMFKPFFAKDVAKNLELFKKNDSLVIMKELGIL
jgi:hypothetical protein